MTIPGEQMDACLADPARRTIDAIQNSIERLDFESAAVSLLARAKRGELLPIELVSQVVPRVYNPMLAVLLVLLGDGDRGDAVATLLETDEFPEDNTGFLVAITCTLSVVAISSRSVRPRLAVQARVLANAAGPGAPPGIYHALHALARALNDELLARALPEVTDPAPQIVVATEALGRLSRDQLVMTIDGVIDADTAHARAADAALRAQLDRNEPCWCGSGRKFKRCHAADELPTREVRPAHLLTLDDVRRMVLSELAEVRFSQLGDEQLGATIQRLLKYRAWSVAERALGALVAREHLSRDARDGARLYFIVRALRGRRFELVTRHMEALQAPRFDAIRDALILAVAMIKRSPDAIDRLIAFSERAVRDRSGLLISNLGETLSPLLPAFGLLILRGAVASDVVETKRDQMFHMAEEARARLLLEPGEPSRTMYAAWKQAKLERREDAAHERRLAEASAEAERLRAAIGDANRRTREAERRADDLEQRLRDQALARPVDDEPAEPAELRALREKIDGLQAAIRDKNAELVEFRRHVSALGDASSAPVPPADPPAEDHDDGWDDLDALDRKIVVPTWRDSAITAVESVPAHVAREALRTIAELAAGESLAWRGVKRAKRVPVLMCRVGLHHRLVFRAQPGGTLDIIELVSRQGLEHALRRYA
jgi:hypothetical protein